MAVSCQSIKTLQHSLIWQCDDVQNSNTAFCVSLKLPFLDTPCPLAFSLPPSSVSSLHPRAHPLPFLSLCPSYVLKLCIMLFLLLCNSSPGCLFSWSPPLTFSPLPPCDILSSVHNYRARASFVHTVYPSTDSSAPAARFACLLWQCCYFTSVVCWVSCW